MHFPDICNIAVPWREEVPVAAALEELAAGEKCTRETSKVRLRRTRCDSVDPVAVVLTTRLKPVLGPLCSRYNKR